MASLRGLVAAVALVLLPAAATPAPRPARCPDGRFLVEGAPLVGDTASLARDAAAIAGNHLALDGGCAPATLRAHRTHKATVACAPASRAAACRRAR